MARLKTARGAKANDPAVSRHVVKPTLLMSHLGDVDVNSAMINEAINYFIDPFIN